MVSGWVVSVLTSLQGISKFWDSYIFKVNHAKTVLQAAKIAMTLIGCLLLIFMFDLRHAYWMVITG